MSKFVFKMSVFSEYGRSLGLLTTESLNEVPNARVVPSTSLRINFENKIMK